MIQLEVVFGLQVATGILMIIFLQKISRIQKKMDKVIKEVESYISFIAEEEEQESLSERKMDRTRAGQAERHPVRKMTKQEKEDAQNKLIQSVLGEYFP